MSAMLSLNVCVFMPSSIRGSTHQSMGAGDGRAVRSLRGWIHKGFPIRRPAGLFAVRMVSAEGV